MDVSGRFAQGLPFSVSAPSGRRRPRDAAAGPLRDALARAVRGLHHVLRGTAFTFPHRTMRRLLLALLLVLGAAPAAAQDTTTAVRPADVIRLTVWRQPELSGEFPIAPDGTILHPLLTEVRVVGRTRDQVRDALRQVLQRYDTDPQFVFDYLYRIGVTGEVRLPNLYNLPPETTVTQALAAAGGVSEFGRLDQVRLIRGGREITLDLSDPSPEVTEMRVRSGDQFRVPRRGTSWRDYIGLGAAIVAAVASVVAAIRAGTEG
jgi:polysaccharide export outer membrane protein